MPAPRHNPAPATIAARVAGHFRAHQRDLPWRNTGDPYAVWVSEIMLQQTRVATVIPYYERWLAAFPTVDALSRAEVDDVLALWSGLGYYSRARNLHRGAREVVSRYGGVLPSEADQLVELPGIGRYTAGAIASLAFGRRAPLVDGNVARVLARVYALDCDVKSSPGQRRLWALAAELVQTENPSDLNQGLMELGATVCTPRQPACLGCPISRQCQGRAQGRQAELPILPPRKKTADKPLLAQVAMWSVRGRRVLLGQRPAHGLYAGLWELPQAESIGALKARFDGKLELAEQPVATERRVLSHRRLQIEVRPGRLMAPMSKLRKAGYANLRWRSLDDVDDIGLASATKAIITRYERSGRDKTWHHTKTPSRCSNKATRKSSKA